VQFHMIANGPKPVAPFSHAVEADGFAFVTGQMPDTPGAAGVLPKGVVAQTHAVMENLKTVLSGISLGLEHGVMTRIYLTNFKKDLCAYKRGLSRVLRSRPAPRRTCVGVTGLAL
jgi:2-iminobutanoate/2-iminopropanoate deaminase